MHAWCGADPSTSRAEAQHVAVTGGGAIASSARRGGAEGVVVPKGCVCKEGGVAHRDRDRNAVGAQLDAARLHLTSHPLLAHVGVQGSRGEQKQPAGRGRLCRVGVEGERCGGRRGPEPRADIHERHHRLTQHPKQPPERGSARDWARGIEEKDSADVSFSRRAGRVHLAGGARARDAEDVQASSVGVLQSLLLLRGASKPHWLVRADDLVDEWRYQRDAAPVQLVDRVASTRSIRLGAEWRDVLRARRRSVAYAEASRTIKTRLVLCAPEIDRVEFERLAQVAHDRLKRHWRRRTPRVGAGRQGVLCQPRSRTRHVVRMQRLGCLFHWCLCGAEVCNAGDPRAVAVERVVQRAVGIECSVTERLLKDAAGAVRVHSMEGVLDGGFALARRRQITRTFVRRFQVSRWPSFGSSCTWLRVRLFIAHRGGARLGQTSLHSSVHVAVASVAAIEGMSHALSQD
eukprot:scaffold1991_cov111-Isochrysis_galbana.AAC.9